jgi:SPP1 family predicted phage head-tail adaptor
MNPGRLRHKIDIEVESTTQNTFGEQTQSWSVFLNDISASISPISGREFFSADMVNAEITHKIRIRYRTGMHPKMRVKFGTRYFDIQAVINFEERNKEILLMCKEAI